jgi:hypothetical protein
VTGAFKRARVLAIAAAAALSACGHSARDGSVHD